MIVSLSDKEFDMERGYYCEKYDEIIGLLISKEYRP